MVLSIFGMTYERNQKHGVIKFKKNHFINSQKFPFNLLFCKFVLSLVRTMHHGAELS